MEADERLPIILGRPFLRTARALVDVFEGKITLRAGDDSVTYVAKSIRHPSGQDGLLDPCHPVYAIGSFILGMDPSLEHPRSVRVCWVEEREAASSREAMELDRERGGGKRKFVEFGDKRNKIEEWSYRDAVSWRTMEFDRGGGSSTWAAD